MSLFCQSCGHDGGGDNPLETHHKDRNHRNNASANRIILCRVCHYREHGKTYTPGSRVVKHSISFQVRQLKALEFAAAEDGHHNVSRLVQDLVEDELRRRYGRNWIVEVGPEPEAVPDGQAA
jgi:hypothetical protein